MKEIKVLGPGCANCKATATLIDSVAKEAGVDVQVVKIEDMREIVSFGVMSTPAVVIDGRLVHVGGIPARASIKEWLK